MAEVMRRLEYKGDLHTDLLLIDRLRRSNGKPCHVAVDLLRDVIQWYLPNNNGVKKFPKDMLQRSNSYYASRGYTRKQLWEAWGFLQALGLVKIAFRYERYQAKVRYVEPVPESVYELLKTHIESKALKGEHSSLEGTSNAPWREQQTFPSGHNRRSLAGTTKGLSEKVFKEKGINTTSVNSVLVNDPLLPENQQGEGRGEGVGEGGEGEVIPLGQPDDLTTIATDCTKLVRDAFPNIPGSLGRAGVVKARSLYASDADFRFALTHGIGRNGIREWSHVIHRLKESAPGIADKRIAWEEEEERKAKREALWKEEVAKREAERKEADAKRKEAEAVERAKELAEFNSIRERFGAPLASAVPRNPEQADLETLKGIARNVWLDEEYGTVFREDTKYGTSRVIGFLAVDLKFVVMPHGAKLLEYLASLRLAACGFVECVERGGHSQAA
jgi:hypothetical protein